MNPPEVVRKAPFEFHPEHRRKKIKTVQVSKLSEIFGAQLTTTIPDFQKYVETLLGLESDVVFNFVEGTVSVNIPNVYETVADWWCRLRGYSFFYGEKPIIDRVEQYMKNPDHETPPQPEFFVLYAYIKEIEASDNLYTWCTISDGSIEDIWADLYIAPRAVWERLRPKWIEGYKSFYDDVDVDHPDDINFNEYGFDFEYVFKEGDFETKYRLFTLFENGKTETRMLIYREGYWIAAPYAHLNIEVMETLAEIL